MQKSVSKNTGLEEMIKAEAYRLGFSLCGITTPESPDQFYRYTQWLDNGFNAGMSYLSTPYHLEARQNPHRLMPSVQSIICLAYPYPLHPIESLSTKDLHLIAGYATEDDYHLELPKKLAVLITYIENLFTQNITEKIYTDSAPILERELASRAGLGWIGRNSCLINPVQGSAFLLAEIFIDKVLLPDEPFVADRCGTCNRCVEACPTGAILSDRSIDSNRCLSYHSIENKQDIPGNISEKLSPWLFGCDICQMVCPWNKNSIPNGFALSFTTREVIDFLHLNPIEFLKYFGNTAIQRAKYFGFMRNLLINVSSLEKNVSLPAIREFITFNQDEALTKIANSFIEKIEKRPPL